MNKLLEGSALSVKPGDATNNDGTVVMMIGESQYTTGDDFSTEEQQQMQQDVKTFIFNANLNKNNFSNYKI